MIHGYHAIDYQVHSLCSHDGLASVRDQCARAIEIGLDEIGFSEHKDFDPTDPAVDFFDYARYSDEIAAARDEYEGRLTIRMGVEVDYQRWFEDEIATFLDRHPFDFVIGSVHYVASRMLMTPDYLADRSREEAYSDYYRAVIDSARSGLIDIVGHLEYANRRGVTVFGSFDPAPYRALLEELFEEMISRGVALEINTAGLRQGVGLTYPCEAHVALYASLGGRLLSLGSDSHQPADLAHRYVDAAEMALRHELTRVVSWENRVPTEVPLRPGT